MDWYLGKVLQKVVDGENHGLLPRGEVHRTEVHKPPLQQDPLRVFVLRRRDHLPGVGKVLLVVLEVRIP